MQKLKILIRNTNLQSCIYHKNHGGFFNHIEIALFRHMRHKKLLNHNSQRNRPWGKKIYDHIYANDKSSSGNICSSIKESLNCIAYNKLRLGLNEF